MSRSAPLTLSLLAALLLSLWSALAADAASVYTSRTTNPGQVYAIGLGAGGELAVPSPPAVNAGKTASGLGITPDGRSLYATDSTAAGTTLSQFGIGADGALSPLVPSTVPSLGETFVAAVSPDGLNLYTAAVSGSGDKIQQYSVQAGGTLAPKVPPSVSSIARFDIVLSADGKHLYASSFGNPGVIDQFAVGPAGALTPLNPPSVADGAFPVGMAVSPDGRFLYAGHESAYGISQFAIGPTGALSALSPPNIVLPASTNSEDLVVSADGTNLYATDTFQGGIVQLGIGPTGALSALSPIKVDIGDDITAAAISPSGRNLYVGSLTDESTKRFAVGPGGALAATTNAVTATGTPNQIVISPDQGPTAALAVSVGLSGRPTRFDASASTDPDGRVVRYDWSFGDGVVASTAVPTVSHVYARRGSYTASVTVTDDEGASTARVFTGHQMLRNGSPAAKREASFPVAASVPTVSAVKLRPNRFAVGVPKAKVKRGASKKGAFLSFRLDMRGVLIEEVRPGFLGHKKHRRCRKRFTEGPRCQVFRPALKRTENLSGRKGANRVEFSGRFAGRKLKPGLYELILRPTNEGQRGRGVAATFTILPPAKR